MPVLAGCYVTKLDKSQHACHQIYVAERTRMSAGRNLSISYTFML